MSSDTPPELPGRSIARPDLEMVIRRAVELSLRESDSQEKLSEAEVIRIATELGLSPQHVRQALYELPDIRPHPSVLDGFYRSPVVAVARAVPGEVNQVERRFEDYLSTREYLQLVRRVREKALFKPAEDAISKLARGLLRPGTRYQLARADRLLLHVRSLDERRSHVLIESDLSSQRRASIRGSIVAGGLIGLAVGGGLAALVHLGGMPIWANTVLDVLAVGGGTVSSVVAAVAVGGRRFRRRLATARTELESLLDRAERGESLEPPPSPWWRRMQQRFRAAPRPRR